MTAFATAAERAHASESLTEQLARRALRDALDAAAGDASVANFVVRGVDLADCSAFSIDFEAEVAAEVVADVLAAASALADRELLAYDPSLRPSSGQALFDGLDSVPQLAALHATVTAGDPPIDTARRGETRERVISLVHRVEGMATAPITAYRFTGPGIATRRPRGLRILLPRDGVWVRVPDELIYYQARFDAVVVGEVVLVTAPTTVQRVLGSGDRAKRMAQDTFRSATVAVAIEGGDALAEAIGSDPAMIAKMAQLTRTIAAEPDYAAHLTTERLLQFIDDNPQIKVATEGTGAERRLVFEPAPQQRYLIPKLLADDFLRSELTNRRYEAGSKHRIDG